MAGADDTDPAIADTHASVDPREDASASHSASRGPRAVRPGDTLGRYEIGEELGEGGMATVFRARDKELRRDVAVKVLFPHLARRPDVVRRFHREARAAAGLEHKNILRIYDVGGAEGDDPPFIVMEMIRGRTLLAEIEQRGAMFAEVAASIGALLADALAAAHAAGIVHRDVKPANVLIAAGGRLLLADFGVARLETEDSLVTKTGALLGTPAYMSPEQATGDTATAKSDLYSLGATLYQLATGTLPYTGSPAKVLAQISVGGMVAPVKKRASVGPDLSRLIERLMATEPEQRVASAAAAAAELRAIVAASGLGEPANELSAFFTDPEAFVRDRTPRVVTHVVAAARAALAEAKLPRAMALADRASALAPGDPEVTALIERVAEGGRSTRRRRALGLGVLGLALVGGGAAAAYRIVSGGAAATPDALLDAAPAVIQDARPLVVVSADASPDAPTRAPVDDAALAPLVDAAVRSRVDAGLHRDAAATPASVLDAPVASIDAAALLAPPIDAGPVLAPVASEGALVVTNDVWCDVTIDGEQRGRLSARPLRVAAGRHTVVCEQPGTERRWTQTVDVASGETRKVAGVMLLAIDVTIEVDVTIDETPYKAGTVAKLKMGRRRLVAGGTVKDITLTGPCHVRARPELDCYR